MAAIQTAGLDQEAALAALDEWKTTLSGETDSIEGDGEDEEEQLVDEDIDFEEEFELQRRRGAFTRSDFPLLAAVARVFLALPPEAKEDPDRYRRVGFLLPDDMARYDHVIIDEGQDFTYAEIHLVHSLVENTRQAVTISGDAQQRMDWRSGFSSIESIHVPDERRFRIARNYRQTVELSDWVNRLNAACFGKDSLKIEATFQSGPAPTLAVIPEWADMRKSAASSFSSWYDSDQNPFTALLLIGFDARMKRRITDGLSNALESRAIYVESVEDGRMIERGRVSVADVPTVKGLEFDGVVVVVRKEACALLDQTSPAAIIARNKLYVGCSRAKRNLSVILQGDVSHLKESGFYE
jgi:superfamily I DNA/RNA helicase